MLEMAGATIRKHLVGRKEPKQNAQLRSEATPEQEGIQKDEGLSLGVRGSECPTAVIAYGFLSGGPWKC